MIIKERERQLNKIKHKILNQLTTQNRIWLYDLTQQSGYTPAIISLKQEGIVQIETSKTGFPTWVTLCQKTLLQ